jgi:hypothetical protein
MTSPNPTINWRCRGDDSPYAGYAGVAAPYHCASAASPYTHYACAANSYLPCHGDRCPLAHPIPDEHADSHTPTRDLQSYAIPTHAASP